MLIQTLLAAVLLAAPATTAPKATATLAPDRGRVAWFDGSYEQALAEAERTGRILFLDFWTGVCPWCQAMGRDTFSDATVVAELSAGVLCFSVDTESPAGRTIAKSFGVRDLPALLFLEPDGSPRDALSGFFNAPRFRSEVQRIKRGEETVADFNQRIAADPNDLVARICLAAKLRRFARTVQAEAQMDVVRKKLERGEGYDRDSIESRWAVASKLREVGELELYRQQADAILRLDRGRQSLAARSIAVYDAIERLRSEGEDGPLRELLEHETDANLCFSGWYWVAALADARSKEADRNSFPEDAAEFRRQAREARRTAWPHCPAAERALFANNLAWAYWQEREGLSAEERRFALQVAELAVQLEPGNVLLLDTYACCLWMNDRKADALAQVRRCIELDPENKEWRKRLTQLGEND